MATAATNKAKKVARQAEIDAEREAQELLAQEDDIDEGSDEDNISDDDLEGLIVRPTKRPRIRILNQWNFNLVSSCASEYLIYTICDNDSSLLLSHHPCDKGRMTAWQ